MEGLTAHYAETIITQKYLRKNSQTVIMGNEMCSNNTRKLKIVTEEKIIE
jgi:hypothetical protein